MTDAHKDTWSDLSIRGIEDHIMSLRVRIPALEENLTCECSYGTRGGSDIRVSIVDANGVNHYLLFEVEQYASGTDFEGKVRGWADRHFRESNTTTVVVSLVLQALRNRLINEFSRHDTVASMVSSPAFRIFPGSGDGGIVDDLKSFITFWIEQRL